MKRFYKDVSISEQGEMFAVLLDGKNIKTPQKSLCLMPTRGMADAVAKEWNDQEEEIDPVSMPITKLMNTAIDRIAARRSEVIDELMEFAGSDQLCYRAENPQELVKLQNEIWDPLLARMRERHTVELKLTAGIIFQEQDPDQILKIRKLIENIENFPLMAFYGMTTVCGSVTIGVNLFEGHISTEEAWEAGHLDENFQVSKWGSDYEAEDRRANLKAELGNAARFLSLCR